MGTHRRGDTDNPDILANPGMKAEAMTDKPAGLYNLTNPVVMTFPNLFEPKAFKGAGGKDAGEPKYSANFLFNPDHPDLRPLKLLAVQVAHSRWPGRDVKTIAFPFTSGDKANEKAVQRGKSARDWQAGKIVVAARSKYQPRLAAIVNGRIVDFDNDAAIATNKGLFYSGVEVLAQFNLTAYQGIGQNPDGVNVYLNMIMSTNKGARIATGGMSAVDAFRGYVGAVSDTDPTGGADPNSLADVI